MDGGIGDKDRSHGISLLEREKQMIGVKVDALETMVRPSIGEIARCFKFVTGIDPVGSEERREPVRELFPFKRERMMHPSHSREEFIKGQIASYFHGQTRRAEKCHCSHIRGLFDLGVGFTGVFHTAHEFSSVNWHGEGMTRILILAKNSGQCHKNTTKSTP